MALPDGSRASRHGFVAAASAPAGLAGADRDTFAAAGYFRAGTDLAASASWERDRDLCYALHLEGAECAYLSGDVGG